MGSSAAFTCGVNISRFSCFFPFLHSFPFSNPRLWLQLISFYPLVSVLPQGMIYRPFIFTRYEPIVSSATLQILLSSLVFGLAHIVFRNALVVGLAFGGGLLFAHTHQRSSYWIACLEHALYGLAIFSSPLGGLFYDGSWS